METAKGGVYCCVKSCKNKQSTFRRSFFRIPQDPERAAAWAIACNRIDLLNRVDNLHKSHRVCATHFENQMFLNDLQNRLQPTAIPSIFPALERSSAIKHDHNYSTHNTEPVSNNNNTFHAASEIDKAGQRIVFISLDNPYDNTIYKMLPEGWKTFKTEPSLIETTSEDQYTSFNVPDRPKPKRMLSPLHVVIPEDFVENSTICSTQTGSTLSAHTPRKEKLRQKIKSLRSSNERLQKKVTLLNNKLNTLDHITLEQYKMLTYRFSGSPELSEFIITKINQAQKQGIHKGKKKFF